MYACALDADQGLLRVKYSKPAVSFKALVSAGAVSLVIRLQKSKR